VTQERDERPERERAHPAVEEEEGVERGREDEQPINVGFVVDSERRARLVHEIATRQTVVESGMIFLTAVAERARADPLGARWTDGRAAWSTRDLAPAASPVDWPILTAGCLSDADAVAALNDRGTSMLPILRPYIR
jgi:hypothetical protein